MYAWWSKDIEQRHRRIYGGGLEVRKYLGRRAAEKSLQGHHLGVYMQELTYDFETGSKGHLSNLGYGVGAGCGYSLPVARRLNIGFSIGVGYDSGKYKVYEPGDDCHMCKETGQRHWFNPTWAEISLIWLPGYGSQNSKKGRAK